MAGFAPEDYIVPDINACYAIVVPLLAVMPFSNRRTMRDVKVRYAGKIMR